VQPYLKLPLVTLSLAASECLLSHLDGLLGSEYSEIAEVTWGLCKQVMHILMEVLDVLF